MLRGDGCWGNAISNWDECFFFGGELHILGSLLYKFTSKETTLLIPISKGGLIVHVG